jgi:hypothetical protein
MPRKIRLGVLIALNAVLLLALLVRNWPVLLLAAATGALTLWLLNFISNRWKPGAKKITEESPAELLESAEEAVTAEENFEPRATPPEEKTPSPDRPGPRRR